jgi:hypothetical protein
MEISFASEERLPVVHWKKAKEEKDGCVGI